MTMPRRTLLLGAAAVAVASISSGAAAASSSQTAAASISPNRWLQNNEVLSVCPDGTQCDRGDRCYKTGREQRETGLDEYKCGDCDDIDDNNGRCEFAEEVFCVVGDGVDPSTWFCVNEGRCINDRVGSNDRARCQCSSRYEGPNCQLEKSQSSNPSVVDDTNDPEPAASTRSTGSSSLSIGAIVGIAVGGFLAVVGLLLLLGRRKSGRDDDHSGPSGSVIDSVEESRMTNQEQHGFA